MHLPLLANFGNGKKEYFGRILTTWYLKDVVQIASQLIHPAPDGPSDQVLYMQLLAPHLKAASST